MAKKAAVINDLSGFGKCSLSAAIAVLSACGVQPCAIPTAVLTNQTGFNNYNCVDFTEYMSSYIDIWKGNKAAFDGIYSGYIANVRQVGFITEFIRTFKKDNTLVLVDPVMGDNGRIYKGYSKEMCDKMRMLAAKADYITPNLTELCILADKSYTEVSGLPFEEKLSEIRGTAYRLAESNNQTVAVTGIVSGDKIINYVFGNDGEISCESDYCDVSFSGTGDLFASAFFGSLLKGLDVSRALEAASGFIEKSVFDTVLSEDFDPNDGVEFEQNLRCLIE